MELFLILGGLTSIVWGIVLLRNGGLLAGCLAVLLTGSCLGHDFFHVSILTVDRLLLGILVAAYLVFGRRGWAACARPDRYDALLFLWLAWLGLSAFLHDRTYAQSRPVSLYVFFFFLPAVVYWLARESPLDERRSRISFGVLAGFGVYLGFTALAEVAEIGVLVRPGYILSSEYVEFLGRARGPFLNPVGLGIFLSAATVCGAMFWPRVGLVGRVALLGLLGLFLAGAYCTMTRSVWLGIGAACVLVLALCVPRHYRPLMAVSLLVGVSLVLIARWDSLKSFKRDKHVTAQEMAESAQLRPILAHVAWQMFQDRPWFGVGLGQYRKHSIYYLSDRNSDLVLEKVRPYVQHNLFLAHLCESGLVGVGLLVILLTAWGYRAWELWAKSDLPLAVRQHGLVFLATLLAYLLNGMFHDVGIINMVHVLMFYLAGTVAAASRAAQSVQAGTSPAVWSPLAPHSAFAPTRVVT